MDRDGKGLTCNIKFPKHIYTQLQKQIDDGVPSLKKKKTKKNQTSY